MVGRTHGVHAEPITFGAKLAGWAFELERDRERLERALEGMRVGKLSGAVGTYGGGDPEVERLACERLGLEPRAGGDAGRPARPPRRAPLARSPSAPRRSSASRPRSATSPARRCARCRSRSGAARRARPRCRTSATRSSPSASAGSRASSARRPPSGSRTSRSGTSATSRTRAPSASSCPDAFLALDYMLDRFAWLVDGLVVDAERMRRNLDASHGLVFSQRVLLALVDVGPRARRRLPARAAERAARLGRGARLPRLLVEADPEIAARLGPSARSRRRSTSPTLSATSTSSSSAWPR